MVIVLLLWGQSRLVTFFPGLLQNGTPIASRVVGERFDLPQKQSRPDLLPVWFFGRAKPHVEYTVERSRHMETVQIVLDKGLLQAADRAARRMKQNRSALIRQALREHLKRLGVRISEERDREGYARRPQALEESSLWEAEAAWPAE